jgi:uncharacterized protein (TIGR00255 family)
MTGYARHFEREQGREITVELKSVNHRFLDLAFRLPRPLQFLENGLRKQLASRLARGHVDISINYVSNRDDSVQVEVNQPLAKAYHKALKQLAKENKLSHGPALADLAALPEVLRTVQPQEDEDMLQVLCERTMNGAISRLLEARSLEGEALKADLMVYLSSLMTLQQQMAALAPQQSAQYQQRLTERLSALNAEGVDAQRLAQEVALFADRCAIDEELSRLQAHCQQMQQLIESSEPAGRKMDFLAQEMHREANTITSKSSELEITRLALESKALIEKLREQVQNVE